MTNIKTILFLIFCPFLLYGQNIIPNPSFEDVFQGSFGVTKAQDWISPSQGSPDLMNNRSIEQFRTPQNYIGYQTCKNGESYFGLSFYIKDRPGFREYIQTRLKKSLQNDSVYCFQAFISLADSVIYALRNNLGIHLSSNAPSINSRKNIDLNPSIEFVDSSFFVEKAQWIKLEAQYKAIGNEKYITIGNFRPDSLIDLLMLNDGGSIQSNNESSYYYIDYLYLGHCDSVPLDTPTGIAKNSLVSKLKGYPNPVNEQYVLENNSNQFLNFQLYNLHGSKIPVAVQQSNKKYSFSMGHLPKGIYLLQVIGAGERATMKIIKD